MQVTLAAAGSPAEIAAALNRDIARERTSNENGGGVLLAVRDYVAKETGAARVPVGSESPDNYVVSAEIKITVERKEDAAEAERARLALVGGAPVTSKTAPAFAKIDELDKSRRASDAERARIDAENAGKLK